MRTKPYEAEHTWRKVVYKYIYAALVCVCNDTVLQEASITKLCKPPLDI